MDVPFALWLLPAFFVVAGVYSSVGFGGGSSYLALLALAGLSHTVVPQVALACNLVVATGGVWHFWRSGALDGPRILPFLVLSVPAAWLGGTLPVGRVLFTVLLGVSLFAAGARAFFRSPARRATAWSERRRWAVGLPVGGFLGFLAGLVGIGGGVFLAPVLLLTGVASVRGTAAASALFILVNSLAGMVGQLHKGVALGTWAIPLVLVVLAGGQIGSRMGAYRIPVRGLQRMIAALIVAVSIKVLWTLV